ncbi:hypothetical protein L9F63_003840 [Diploptera punctata]|uniref:DRBM domain-containing protein n=1 Tax=Diploptera punctata TaxID=6984 RepID=A0AAD8E9F3_DIPPU|nr:hypothetical protein L9F63_003840 [Diploptera punctata]
MSDFNSGYSTNYIYKQKEGISAQIINKTPISLLQERFSRLGKKPNYELLQEGICRNNCNSYCFCFRVSVGEISAIGCGKSKKEAKHAAASLLLNMLFECNFSQITNLEGSDCLPWIPFQKNVERISGNEIYNPVGKLQEICTAKHWAHPDYVLVSEQGPPHDRIFMISVQVQNIKLIGTGRSKRLAKRDAALKILKRLLNINSEDESGNSCEMVVANTYTNYAQILEEIATKSKFDVYYERIDNKTANGLYKYIIHVTTFPNIVCLGKGATPEKAIENSTMKALICLKILQQKKYYNKIIRM